MSTLCPATLDQLECKGYGKVYIIDCERSCDKNVMERFLFQLDGLDNLEQSKFFVIVQNLNQKFHCVLYVGINGTGQIRKSHSHIIQSWKIPLKSIQTSGVKLRQLWGPLTLMDCTFIEWIIIKLNFIFSVFYCIYMYFLKYFPVIF